MANQVWLTKDKDGDVMIWHTKQGCEFSNLVEYDDEPCWWDIKTFSDSVNGHYYTRKDAKADCLAMKLDQFNKQFPEGGAKAFMRVK